MAQPRVIDLAGNESDLPRSIPAHGEEEIQPPISDS
jgi:hypothetical protein